MTFIVVSFGLSSSSDEHHPSHSCLGTGMLDGKRNNTFVIIVHIWSIGITDSSLVVLACWLEQYQGTATSGTDCLDPLIGNNFGFVCVSELATESRYCYCGTRVRDGRSRLICYCPPGAPCHDDVLFGEFVRANARGAPAWDETMARPWERIDLDAAVGPRFGQAPPPGFTSPTPACTYR